VHLTKYYSGDQIEKNDMGGACSTYGGMEEVHTGFWWGNMKEITWKTGVDGRIILRWIFRMWNGGDGLD
jgi:hypothetical protein